MKKQVTILRLIFGSLMAVWIGCARSPIRSNDQAVRLTSRPIQLSDDLHLQNLQMALSDQIAMHQQLLKTPLKFGKKIIDRAVYIQNLKALVTALDKGENEFFKTLNQLFEIDEVYGDQRYGDVFITGYFSPVIKAAHRPKGDLIQPLYFTPRDLVIIDVKAYQERFSHFSLFSLDEQKSVSLFSRGRLVKGDTDIPKVVPYFDRHEIDAEKRLQTSHLELAYVDPIDAFILQIQGSGTLMFSDGQRWTIGYAAQNGFPYVAVGKFLVDRIPLEKMTLQKIEFVLRTLSQSDRQTLMDQNPSYVFFKILKSPAVTFFGTAVNDGRTIATDPKYFPKGVLALLEFNKPLVDSQSLQEPDHFQKVMRLVIDQDTGGAIRGPGRVDLFFGKGDIAKAQAGVMKSHGRLFYFVPRGRVVQPSS